METENVATASWCSSSDVWLTFYSILQYSIFVCGLIFEREQELLRCGDWDGQTEKGRRMEGELVQQPQPQQQERLNQAVQQQLNLEQVKTRAISLFKAISRILEDFDAYGRTNTNPKWQDILGQYSMVNLELFNIVDDIKKVSKAFIVYPKNVNAENATSMNT